MASVRGPLPTSASILPWWKELGISPLDRLFDLIEMQHRTTGIVDLNECAAELDIDLKECMALLQSAFKDSHPRTARLYNNTDGQRISATAPLIKRLFFILDQQLETENGINLNACAQTMRIGIRSIITLLRSAADKGSPSANLICQMLSNAIGPRQHALKQRLLDTLDQQLYQSGAIDLNKIAEELQIDLTTCIYLLHCACIAGDLRAILFSEVLLSQRIIGGTNFLPPFFVCDLSKEPLSDPPSRINSAAQAALPHHNRHSPDTSLTKHIPFTTLDHALLSDLGFGSL